jgi:hypothetical protein
MEILAMKNLCPTLKRVAVKDHTRGDSAVFLILVLLQLCSFVGQGRAQARAQLIGLQMNSGVLYNQPWPAVSFGSTRLWNSDTHWRDINPSEGVYNWTVLDMWLASAQLHHVDVLYAFGWLPTWASSNPNDSGCAGGMGACDPPKDLNPDGTGPDQLWKSFVTALVEHNQKSNTARIQFWETWNEAYHTRGWNGTNAQMLRMAQDAAGIIKKADPSAVILAPSFAFTGPGLAWLDTYLLAGGGRYADAIAVHGYVQTPHRPWSPENFLNDLSLVETLLSKDRQVKPVWDTEASWGNASKTGPRDLDMQAAYVARFYLLHWSAGVPRFYWYQWNSQDDVGTLWVPDRHNGKGTILKPGVAYGQMYQWMVGAKLTSRCSNGNNGSVWKCDLSRSGGYQARAIWDTAMSCNQGTCKTTQYQVDPKYKQYRTLDGRKIAITRSTVPIGAKPILLEN